MATINRFEDLDIWKKARVLCTNIFLKTKNPDFAKDFALKDQIKRSSGSVMDNIAEVLKGKAIRNLLIFYQSQKDLVAKHVHKFIGLMILNILMSKSLKY